MKLLLGALGIAVLIFVAWEELQSRKAIDQFWEDWARPPR
jgi:hypothetical protein